jgi:DNA-binding MarR family transcriptional regulator
MRDAEPLADSIRHLMETFFMRSMRDWTRYVRSAGLSLPQFGLLMRLHHGGHCEVREIGEHFDITSPAASQLVERLVQGGLVERTEDPDDRRARQITLSARGRALVEAGIRERYRWVGDLVTGLSSKEAAAVKAALPAFQAVLAPTAKPAPQKRNTT